MATLNVNVPVACAAANRNCGLFLWNNFNWCETDHQIAASIVFRTFQLFVLLEILNTKSVSDNG